MDQYLDVRLEIETCELEAKPDPTRYVIETLRHQADEACHHHGAHLRTDRAPELLIEHAQHRLTGRPTTLIASRWAIITPRDQTRPGGQPRPAHTP